MSVVTTSKTHGVTLCRKHEYDSLYCCPLESGARGWVVSEPEWRGEKKREKGKVKKRWECERETENERIPTPDLFFSFVSSPTGTVFLFLQFTLLLLPSPRKFSCPFFAFVCPPSGVVDDSAHLAIRRWPKTVGSRG